MSAGHGLNFFQQGADALGIGEYENLLAAFVTAAIVTVLAWLAGKRLKNSTNPVVPDAKLTLRNMFELLAGFIVMLGDMVMGKHNRKYLPFAGTVFFYVFAMNLIGLIPGFSAATDHAGINFGIAVIVFSLFNYWGIREVGLGSYFKHFCGPVNIHWAFWALAPVIFTLEMISIFVRPATLTLRLFGNMTADHTVLSVFSELTRAIWVPIPVIFYLLGTLVCFVQAFVFFVLTMVYISLAVSHGHDEEHEEAH